MFSAIGASTDNNSLVLHNALHSGTQWEINGHMLCDGPDPKMVVSTMDSWHIPSALATTGDIEALQHSVTAFATLFLRLVEEEKLR